MALFLDLAGLQLDALPATPADAGPGEGLEEATASVDVAQSLARAERHAVALRAVGGVLRAPRYDERAAYAAYVQQAVDALGLRSISGAEIVAVHSRVTASGVRNRLPKPWGLLRLLPLLVYDQAVRDQAGRPLRFNSIHRDSAYNAAIGGASKSAHRACTARDRVLVGGTVAELHEIDRKLRRERVTLTSAQRAVIDAVRRDYGLTSPPFGGSVFGEPFSKAGVDWDGAGYNHVGGLGRYATFVHADCRGTATDWRG